MEENRDNIRICACCGDEIDIEEDDYSLVENDILCRTCADNECGVCDHCEELVYNNDAYTDDDHFLCPHCYENHYTRCEDCGRILRSNDAYYSNDYDFCYDCYEKRHSSIHEYSYKPTPIFYGEGKRFFGVELEIDHAGKDDDYAEELLDIANEEGEKIYIKSDGSLDDGMEIVTHPMSLDYHMNHFCWDKLTAHAIRLGYRSHQTSTCGLHVHVSRMGLGENDSEQEDTISRILYFVEAHWNELLKFSRRSEYSMNRWAARHGYDHDPKKLLDKAKSDRNRYVAVNLCNHNTVEFRLFRGTLKLNTLLATLQLINHICELAYRLTDHDLQTMSWSEFVGYVQEPELIQYLKERRLYVNEAIENEEDM